MKSTHFLTWFKNIFESKKREKIYNDNVIEKRERKGERKTNI